MQAAVARVLEGRPHDTLLRRASAGLAVICADLLKSRHGRIYGQRVVLLVGTGNNGADALLAGVHLRRRGVRVDTILTGDHAYEPGLAALRRAGSMIIAAGDGTAELDRAVAAIEGSDMVVDGIVGERGSGGLIHPADKLAAAILEATPVVAVDLPSGVHPDTGEVVGPHVRADVTVTFGAHKPCLLLPPACRAAGRVEFVDVGIDGELVGEPMVWRFGAEALASRWPVPAETDHKYRRGVLGVVAGSDTYPGAAVLASLGAVRAGVGILRYIGPQRVTDHVLRATPEAVPGIGQVQAWLLGSGVEDDPRQDEAIATALQSGLPCVVDAGALEICVRQRVAGSRVADACDVLLTPHAGELARMLGVLGHDVPRADVEARPLHHTRWLARAADATVLLKGSTTVIAGPGGPVACQDDGPSWMATAGSGDVLAGIAGALMSAGTRAMDAGAMATAVHGRAAVRASGGGPTSAAHTAGEIPATIADLRTG